MNGGVALSLSSLKSGMKMLIFSPMMHWTYFCILIMSMAIFMDTAPLLQKLWYIGWGFIACTAFMDIAPKFIAIRQKNYANGAGDMTSENMHFETVDFIGKYIQRVSLVWR